MIGLLLETETGDRAVRRQLFVANWLTLLAVALLYPGQLRADDTRSACSLTPSLADQILCINQSAVLPTAKLSPTKRRSPISDECAALSHWQELLDGVASPNDSDKKIRDNLKTACDQNRNLQVAKALIAQRRFAEAITFLNKIGDPALLPDVTDETRRNLRSATIQQNGTYLPPSNVILLERTKRFEEAYQVLSLARPEIDAHRKNLAALLQIRQSARSLERQHDYQSELASYTAYLTNLDRFRDEYLYAAADAAIAFLQPLARQQADADARSLIEAAEVQIRRGQYEDATTKLAQVTAKAGSISVVVLEDATQKLVDARAKSSREPTLWGTLLTVFWAVWKAFLSVLNWLGYAAAVLALIGAVWLVSQISRLLPPKKSILLDLTDRTSTADPASAAATQANQALSEELRRQMDLPVPDRQLRIDAGNEMNGSSVGQVSLRIPFRTAATVFQSASSIPFGPFSINPFAIWEQIKRAFARHHKIEITGELSVLGTGTICHARLAYGTLSSGGPWEAIATGAASREQAIRDAAMKILLAIDDKAGEITKDAGSMSQLRLGLDFQRRALDDPPNAASFWGQARNAFQQAALDDPANWLARFNLGMSLRKLGLNALAAEQFEELRSNPHLPTEHLAVVMYNRGAALQKTDDKRIAQTVINIMTEILETPKLSPTLHYLASSGLLATIASRHSRISRRRERIGAKEETDRRKRIEQAQRFGAAFLAEVENAIGGTTDVTPSELNVVIAVTLNALGQLKALLDDPEQARVYFRRALTFLPGFIEANLNLAELYLEKKGSIDSNWAPRAETILLDAQNLDASNTRSHVLLGTLYAHPVYGRIDDAIAEFKKALPDPAASQRLGGLYLEQGKSADAIPPLLSAISLDTSLNRSNLLLTRCALALDPSDRRKCTLLRRSDSWVKKMAKGNNGRQYQKEAASLLPKVAAALMECAKTPPVVSSISTSSQAAPASSNGTSHGVVGVVPASVPGAPGGDPIRPSPSNTAAAITPPAPQLATAHVPPNLQDDAPTTLP